MFIGVCDSFLGCLGLVVGNTCGYALVYFDCVRSRLLTIWTVWFYWMLILGCAAVSFAVRWFGLGWGLFAGSCVCFFVVVVGLFYIVYDF